MAIMSTSWLVAHAGLFEVLAEHAVDQPDGREVLHPGEAEPLQLRQEDLGHVERIGGVDAGEHRRVLAPRATPRGPCRRRSRWRCRTPAARRANLGRPCGSDRSCRSRSGRCRRPPPTWPTARCRRRRRRSARAGRSCRGTASRHSRRVMAARRRRSSRPRSRANAASAAAPNFGMVDVVRRPGSTCRSLGLVDLGLDRGEQRIVGLGVVERLARRRRAARRHPRAAGTEPARRTALSFVGDERAELPRSRRRSCASASPAGCARGSRRSANAVGYGLDGAEVDHVERAARADVGHAGASDRVRSGRDRRGTRRRRRGRRPRWSSCRARR